MNQFSLEELRYVGELITERSVEFLLSKLTDVAGGASLLSVPGVAYVCVGVTGDGIAQGVREVIGSFSEHTKRGFLPVLAKAEPLSVYIPFLRNADSSGNREPLFPGASRREVIQSLESVFGPSEEFRAKGYWKDDRRELFEDDNQVLRFGYSGVPDSEVLEAVRRLVLEREDCDQYSIYVSQAGRGALIERASAAEQEAA